MVSKEEFLKGNWWLVIAKYPVACDASIKEVIESKEDPTLESSYVNELIEECVDSFGYLDEFTYDPDLEESEEDPTLESDYANELSDECINSFSYLDSPDIDEDDESQFEDWYEQQLEDIELEAIKIDEKVIDEYGVKWLNDYLA